MKKIILCIGAFVILLGSFKHVVEPLIPEESFRFRIIANSNSSYDQKIKMHVRSLFNQKLSTVMASASSISETKETISAMLPDLEQILEEEVPYSYRISLGQNYFPEKKYKGGTYPEGYYESLVITLGEGAGENWWCVLFPPFCMLDATETEEDQVEYDFFLFELFDYLF